MPGVVSVSHSALVSAVAGGVVGVPRLTVGGQWRQVKSLAAVRRAVASAAELHFSVKVPVQFAGSVRTVRESVMMVDGGARLRAERPRERFVSRGMRCGTGVSPLVNLSTGSW